MRLYKIRGRAKKGAIREDGDDSGPKPLCKAQFYARASTSKRSVRVEIGIGYTIFLGRSRNILTVGLTVVELSLSALSII